MNVQEDIGSQSLTSAALLLTKSYQTATKIRAIYIKASVNITETITITLVSPNGANYDIPLDTKTLNGESSYTFHPLWDAYVLKGGSIKVQCTNANTTGTVYVAIHAEGGIQ